MMNDSQQYRNEDTLSKQTHDNESISKLIEGIGVELTMFK
jgi:hypothetical protein